MKRILLSTAAIVAVASLAAGPAAAQSASSGKQAQAKAPADCPQSFAALDSNSKITAQEASAVRVKAFKALDDDGNDIVSRQEYVRCLASTPAFVVFRMVPKADWVDQSGLFHRSASRFDAADKDDNGKVSWKEYIDAATLDHSRWGELSGQSPQGASAAAGWAFARMDTDMSGSIEKKEWSADAGMKQAADSSFGRLDTNGDDMISQKEYLASDMASAEPRSGTAASETQGAAGAKSDK
jgi:Ca2+-binding EF-hand superfamily protein